MATKKGGFKSPSDFFRYFFESHKRKIGEKKEKKTFAENSLSPSSLYTEAETSDIEDDFKCAENLSNLKTYKSPNIPEMMEVECDSIEENVCDDTKKCEENNKEEEGEEEEETRDAEMTYESNEHHLNIATEIKGELESSFSMDDIVYRCAQNLTQISLSHSNDSAKEKEKEVIRRNDQDDLLNIFNATDGFCIGGTDYGMNFGNGFIEGFAPECGLAHLPQQEIDTHLADLDQLINVLTNNEYPTVEDIFYKAASFY